MFSRFEKFSYFLSEASKLLHRIEADEMESLGLKGPYAIYILTIARFPEGITATQLSEFSARDKADVSRALAILTEKDLVARASSKNRYRAPIILTEKGLAAAERLRTRAACAVEYANRGISEEHRHIFYSVLETLVENTRDMCERGIPE